ncbi:sodium/hydrogen exchanger 10 isoform X9 [Anolis carolinensis]|uniref:sodium/hydrogen exchanger 10 isoform X9 n=1 Tax=Anolis carolinensis TaxID=28377 RepID=UPI002F2B7F44
MAPLPMNDASVFIPRGHDVTLGVDNAASEEMKDFSYGTFHILRPNRPITLLLVFLSCAVGALLRTVLKETKVPILVVIFFIGLVIGIVAHFTHQLPFVKHIAEIDPVLFLHLFTPVIIFTASFEMDFYIFRKSFWQVLVLAVPGFLMNCGFLGWLTFKINKYNWSWDDSMLFGIILSTTDPILSVAAVKNIGLSKIVTNLIKGESLFNDATTVIIFELYRDLVHQSHQEVVKEIFVQLILKFFASIAFGFLSSKLVSYWLAHIFNDGIIEVILSFSMAYVIFFLAEWFGMSGVISLCMLGLLLDSVSFSPGMDAFLYKFWAMLTFLAHIMIYLIMGIVIAQKTFPYINTRGFFSVITVYLSLNLVRALVILTLSPFLSRLGYGFNWRWGAVLVWSGMRGTFTLNMALALSQTPSITAADLQVKTMILLHCGTASLLTLIINSTTVKKLVVTLGLCNITLPKRMAMHNAVQRIRQMEANAFSMLKLDRFLADANWTMAEDSMTIEYPYKLDTEEIRQLSKTLKCPDCDADIAFERSPQQIADIMEEARLRLLTAQIALAMGRTYIYYHWNQFDLIVIVVGIIDVMIINLFKNMTPSYPMINTIRIFRFGRLLRVFRLFKLTLPTLIFVLDKQINKQLTFRYDIAKGYVQGEEDIKRLIEQISGHEKVYIEITKILEKNKQEAMKELGLMQRDYPEIVTAVKTRQAVQTVLNTASETLKFMISGGIVDRNEGAELHKVILVKKKHLAKLPPTIAPPTAQQLLHNVMWLQDNKNQIEFIQKKAKILYYDYGDIICEEGELPQGIHLIVSGMIKLSGSSAPRYGVDKDVMKEGAKKTTHGHTAASSYTDYMVTGAIIGELNCLTKQEMEYAVSCETAVQTCFISIDDLLEAFDRFLEPPSLEYKIWLKIALDIALKTYKENLPNQDWSYKLCAQYSNMYVVDVLNHTKCDIYDEAMDDVILVHGTVQDCQLGQRYCAPCILPKTCHQVQGTSPATKLLIIRSIEGGARKSTGTCFNVCQHHADRRCATLGQLFSMESRNRSSVANDLDYTYMSSQSHSVRKNKE